MAGLLSDLFGGDSSQKTTVTINPQLENASQGALTGSTNLYNQGTGGIYQGSLLAGQNPLVQQGQEQQLQYAQSLIPLQQQQTMAFQNLLGAGDYNNPLLRQQIEQLVGGATDNFLRNVNPQIMQGGTGTGQYGSSRQGVAQGIAMGDTQKAIANATVNALLGGQQTALQAQSLAPSVYQSGLLPAQFTQDVGQQRTARSQQELLDEVQMFNAPRNAELQNLQQYLGLLGANPLVGEQTQVAQGPGSNPLQAGLGMLSMVAGTGKNMGWWGGAG